MLTIHPENKLIYFRYFGLMAKFWWGTGRHKLIVYFRMCALELRPFEHNIRTGEGGFFTGSNAFVQYMYRTYASFKPSRLGVINASLLST